MHGASRSPWWCALPKLETRLNPMHDPLNPSTLDARIRHVCAQLPSVERKLANMVLTRQRELPGYSATELAGLARPQRVPTRERIERLHVALDDLEPQL